MTRNRRRRVLKQHDTPSRPEADYKEVKRASVRTRTGRDAPSWRTAGRCGTYSGPRGRYTACMLILGIESSCDETGVALVAWDETAPAGQVPQLLSHALYSQVAMHEAYGGVVPELASRDHIRRVLPLTEDVLQQAQRSLQDIDVVAFTRGPGLAGALLVGAGVACALGAALQRPVLGVHHLEGHLLSPFLSQDPPQFPFVALLVSGGHSQLMQVNAVGDYRLLGETIDDAAGEAFDKSAKLLGLGYPGGPALARLAESGNPAAFKLPRPLLHSGDLDFSFAGLKTAVMTQARKLGEELSARSADLAASTQAAIVDVLVRKSVQALDATGLHRLVVAGGVGANRALREQLNAACQPRGVRVHYPELSLCTDNGAMIALAAAMRLQSGRSQAQWSYAFDVRPRWPLDQLEEELTAR
jgi:N6-L-threonylcarbamoyladenine synthase